MGSKGKGLRESRPSSVEIQEWRRGGEWRGGRCGCSGRGVWREGGGNGGSTDQRRAYIPPHKRAQMEKEEKAREAREAETERQKAQDEAEKEERRKENERRKQQEKEKYLREKRESVEKARTKPARKAAVKKEEKAR